MLFKVSGCSAILSKGWIGGGGMGVSFRDYLFVFLDHVALPELNLSLQKKYLYGVREQILSLKI